MSSSGIKAAFGGAMISSGRPFDSVEKLKEVFGVLEKYGVKIIDTAQLYGDSEELLGQAKAGSRFTIDTKAKGGFAAGSGTKENIISEAKESIRKLGVDKVDIFYLHAPDSTIPLSSTLAGINEVHKAGLFQRFGLSNYKAEDVQAVHEHCKEKNYILPSVYQGNYSAVARKQETILFPTLRKLGMSFYAYSPLAGGFLTKTKQQVQEGAGRFDPDTPIGKMYSDMYLRPAYLEALQQWEAIAKDAGCSRASLAYRWVKYNCPLSSEHGDAIIVGASSIDQLRQTLEGLNQGPLDKNIVERIDGVWKTIEHEAPLDNYNG
ncbi:hypothetical protein LTR66_012411 [Elasticomyces elasticus]|nr:hypothetical protein LTR66_012411 [Elasticomyces elasticus]